MVQSKWITTAVVRVSQWWFARKMGGTGAEFTIHYRSS